MEAQKLPYNSYFFNLLLWPFELLQYLMKAYFKLAKFIYSF